MKGLIIYASYHHKNTEKIAQIIGSVLEIKIVNFLDLDKNQIKDFDLIGFGSGVYLSKFHKGLINLVKNLPYSENKKAFLFSTSGVKSNIILNRSHKHFKKILKEKNFEILSEFNCPGYDTYSLLKVVGGVNKQRPNQEDLEKAKIFAQSIKNKI